MLFDRLNSCYILHLHRPRDLRQQNIFEARSHAMVRDLRKHRPKSPETPHTMHAAHPNGQRESFDIKTPRILHIGSVRYLWYRAK